VLRTARVQVAPKDDLVLASGSPAEVERVLSVLPEQKPINSGFLSRERSRPFVT
jgi:hypothetical protein